MSRSKANEKKGVALLAQIYPWHMLFIVVLNRKCIVKSIEAKDL